MDRMRIARRILTASGLALALALLGTCSNQFSLLGTLTDEVKVATGKFLVVSSVTPVQSADNVNPGVHIAIVFDRALNESTALASNVVISPPGTFQLELDPPGYVAGSKTLYLKADPCLDNSTNYTIQLTKGLRGADGSELQNVYAWSFRTGIYPAGSVNICKAGQTTKAVATNSTSVNLKFTLNSQADKLRWGFTMDLSGINYQVPGLGGWGIAGDGTLAATLQAVGDGSDDGPEFVYVQFWGDEGESEVGSDMIILDTKAPTATPPGSTRYINIANQATGVTPAATATDGSGSGIEVYEWTSIPAGLHFSLANVLSPYITADSDGTYTARLRVKDYADNWSANCDVTVKRDTMAPVVTFAVNPSEYADWWNIPQHPTVKQMPTWTWNGSEAGTFSLILADSGGRTLFKEEKYKELSYQYSKQFEDSLYTLVVTERDTAGNWSEAASWTFLVTPMIPMHRSSEVPRTLYIQWRAYTGAHHYIFYPPKLDPVTVAANRWPEAGTADILAGEWEWYYEARNISNGLLYRSPKYTFSTAK